MVITHARAYGQDQRSFGLKVRVEMDPVLTRLVMSLVWHLTSHKPRKNDVDDVCMSADR